MKRTLLTLAFLILLAAAINVPMAIPFVVPSNSRFGKTALNVNGPGAAIYRWPDATPHPQPWPAISQWQVDSAFAHRRRNAWSADAARTTTHQMQHDLYGWPLPVLQQTSRWWPWDDPVWKLPTAEQETGLRFYWPGVILNPLIVGSALWLLLFAPPLLWRHYRARRRLRRGQCPGCGYPAGASDRCTECGRALPPELQPRLPAQPLTTPIAAAPLT